MKHKKGFLLGIFISLLAMITSVSAAPSFAQPLEMGFKGVFEALGSKEVSAGLIIIFIYVILYGATVGGLSQVPNNYFTTQSGKPKRTTKAIAASLSGIATLGLFYGLNKTEIFTQIHWITTTFSMTMGVLLVFLMTWLIAKIFSLQNEEVLGHDMRTIGFWIGLGMSMWLVGNMGNNRMISGFGQLILTFFFIWLIIEGINNARGAGKESDALSGDIDKIKDLTDDREKKRIIEEEMRKFGKYDREIDSLKLMIQKTIGDEGSEARFKPIVDGIKLMLEKLSEDDAELVKIVHSDHVASSSPGAIDRARELRQKIEREISNIDRLKTDLDHYFAKYRIETITDLDNAKKYINEDLKTLLEEYESSKNKHVKKLIKDVVILKKRAESMVGDLSNGLKNYDRDYNRLRTSYSALHNEAETHINDNPV